MDDLISKKAAIDALHTWFRDGFDEDKWWNSTHVLAAIEGLPPAQLGTNLAEVGKDCISRQAAISAICNACGKIDCDKMDKCEKLQLPPANCSEFPNSSDTISRAKAIEALEKDMASFDHIIKGMSANDVRLDAYVSQRNQVNYDIYTINNLPPVQPEQLSTNLAEVGTDCISRQQAIDALNEQIELCDKALSSFDITMKDEYAVKVERASLVAYKEQLEALPSAQPEIIRCKDCKYNASTHKCINPDSFFLIPNDDDFCSFAERKTDG